jgi:hypothetical protein
MNQEIKGYKEIFQIAKIQQKVNILKNISIILTNEIMIDGKNYGTIEQTFNYLLEKGCIGKTYKEIVNWFIAWERYFKNCKTEAFQRLYNAKKGIKPQYFPS